MQLERRIFLNTAVLGAGEVVGQLANFGLVVLLARRYGVELLGWYAFAMALGVVLAPFVSLGASTYVTREIARGRDGAAALLGAVRPLQLSSGLAVWLAMAVVAVLSSAGSRETAIIITVGAYHVLNRMTTLFLAPAVAREHALSTAMLGGGHRVLIVSLAGAAIALGFDAPVALLSMPIAGLASLLVARHVAARDLAVAGTHREPIDRAKVLRASLPFLGSALLVVGYNRGGVLLLTGLRDEVATGFFAAADRLLVPVLLVTGTFTAALFAPLSRLAAEPERMKELAARCMRLVLFITIPMSAGLALFAPDIVTLVFGPQLRHASTVLVILAPLAVLRSVSALWNSQCIALGKERRATVVRTWTVVVFFTSATGLILAWGPIGLAFACLLSETLLAFGLNRVLARHAAPRATWRMARGSVAAAACGGAVGLATASLGLPVRLIVVAGTMGLVTVLLGGVRAHDLRYLRAILRSRPERKRSEGMSAMAADEGST